VSTILLLLIGLFARVLSLIESMSIALSCTNCLQFQEERQALLHEGSGSTAVSAFVEIVFDNSDNRFSLENSDEVVLRRTIGHKKDEFFLQRKRATKNEIMSLLEGAGFSKSNPYYIVQQGKVNALCTMNDNDRLRLLKEVAGTTVYDEKKAESLAKMEENKTSIEKIDEILESIEARLDELRGEKEELTQYQKLDRERRAMEYTLYDMELKKARNTLDTIESDRSAGAEALSELHDKSRRTHDSIRSIETQMKTKSNALRRCRMQMKDLEVDQTKAISLRTRLELECAELRENVKAVADTQKLNEKEIMKLSIEISQAEEKLDKEIQPKYDSEIAILDRLTNDRDEAQKKVDSLFAKQGRGRKFSTQKDRDAYLESYIQELQTEMEEKEIAIRNNQDSLSSLHRSIVSEELELKQKNEEGDKQATILQSLNKSIEEKKRERLELHDNRKEQWRKCEELRERVKEFQESFHHCKFNLRKVMPRATSMGLEALPNIVRQERLRVGEQYFGSVMENFDLVDPKFQTAIEVAAQNTLFHVIVDTDATAARLMKRLEKDRLGRVTFLPLNRLQVDKVDYPISPDVRPMITSCIKYDAKLDRAMKHVFGKKLLARNVDVAASWSSRCKMDAITLDGDACTRKGALSGGFVDVNKSRLRAHFQQLAAGEALSKAESEYRDVKQKAEAIDQAATNLMSELQRLEAKNADLNHIITETDGEVEVLQNRIEQQKKQMSHIEKTVIPPVERQLASIASHIKRLEDEMQTELNAGLSEQERQMLSNFKVVQAELTSQIESQNDIVSQLSVERQRLQSLLADNLLKRRHELLEGASNVEENIDRRRSRGNASSAAILEQQNEDLELRTRELDDAVRVFDEIETKIAEVSLAEATLKSELIDAKNEFENLKLQDMNNSQALEQAQQQADKLLNKVRVCNPTQLEDLQHLF
jgi:structural maintenance of chromosome 3 (chondroitin sulfate proteoglycan 6)